MPKKKNRSSAKKRFIITANGHIKHKKAYKSHILNKKDRKRKRGLRKSALIFKGFEKKVRSMIEA
jgi:large subunit ribosomal protein L35